MADDLTPEVMNALVRLMNNETNLDELNVEQLYALGAAARGGRKLLARVITELNRRGETFSEIGEHYGVVESTASRWAKPPATGERGAAGVPDEPAEDVPDEEVQ